MSIRQKLDHVVSALHTLVAAPDADDAAGFHHTIRTVLADLPEPSDPSGLCIRPASSQAVRPVMRRQATEAGGVTIGHAFTDWPFQDLSPTTTAGLGDRVGQGGFGGGRSGLDEPQVVDLWGGPPTPCDAVSRCQAPNVGGRCPMKWLAGVSLHEGNLVGLTDYFAPGFCIDGCLVWY